MDLVFWVIAINGEKGYASDFEKNGLFEVDLKTGNCTFLMNFPKEEINLEHIHCCAKWIGKKIYFIPTAGEYISIYDTENNNIETVKIPTAKQCHFYRQRSKFVDAHYYEGYLWILPHTYPGIIKFNPNSYEMEIIDDWIPDEGYRFRAQAYVDNSIIYEASCINNVVMSFDVKKQEVKVFRIGDNNNGVMEMCKLGDELIFAPKNRGSIVRWNITSNKVLEYDDYPEDFKFGDFVFSNVYLYQSSIVFVPASANYGVVLTNGKLVEDTEHQWKMDEKNRVEYLFETDSKKYFREIYINQKNRFFYLEKSSDKIEEFQFNISNEDKRKKMILESSIVGKEIVDESVYIGLRDWINEIF